MRPGRLNIPRNLSAERLDRRELLFRPEKLKKGDLQIFSIDLGCKIEEMDLERSFSAGCSDRWANANIGDPGQTFAIAPGADEVDPIGRELLVMRREVGGRKTELAAELFPSHHGPEDGIIPAEETAGTREIAGLDSPADQSAADYFAIDRDGRDADF